ncbi:MAG: FAD-dependent oxidoreductase [Polyangiales bacterium]
MTYDLIVAGAGSAGAALAWMAASRGLRVLVLDRRPLERAGATWINDVPGWMFDEAGVARPSGDERHESATTHFFAGEAKPGDVPMRKVRPKEFLGVDMRALVARLQNAARDAGAELVGEEAVRAVAPSGHEVRVTTGSTTYVARHFVDASGLAGVDALGPHHATPRDTCVASQEVRHVRDLDAARAYFDERGAKDGDVLLYAGVAGGYSILNVRRHGDRVFLLSGTIPADGHPSGRHVVDDFVRRHDFLGEREFGGARAIPLVYPRPIVARGRVAALGDAAGQVFSAHGSGVGTGLVAARMLDDALTTGDLRHYQRAFQRRFGLQLATQDLFRRFTQDLSLEETSAMLGEGVLSDAFLMRVLAQRAPRPDLGLLRGARVLARRPALARRLGRVAGQVAQVAALYVRMPDEPRSQDRWAARVHRAMRWQ